MTKWQKNTAVLKSKKPNKQPLRGNSRPKLKPYTIADSLVLETHQEIISEIPVLVLDKLGAIGVSSQMSMHLFEVFKSQVYTQLYPIEYNLDCVGIFAAICAVSCRFSRHTIIVTDTYLERRLEKLARSSAEDTSTTDNEKDIIFQLLLILDIADDDGEKAVQDIKRTHSENSNIYRHIIGIPTTDNVKDENLARLLTMCSMPISGNDLHEWKSTLPDTLLFNSTNLNQHIARGEGGVFIFLHCLYHVLTMSLSLQSNENHDYNHNDDASINAYSVKGIFAAGVECNLQISPFMGFSLFFACLVHLRAIRHGGVEGYQNASEFLNCLTVLVQLKQVYQNATRWVSVLERLYKNPGPKMELNLNDPDFAFLKNTL